VRYGGIGLLSHLSGVQAEEKRYVPKDTFIFR
jgi:hypothetical protein